MDPAKTTWGVGEYPRMAERLVGAAEIVVDLAAVSRGDRVVDIGCGTGDAALEAAARDAKVVGVDIEPALLAVAGERAAAGGHTVTWVEGDAVAVPVAAGQFDVVLSVFGVMYAADQAAAANELARICAPGARLALAAWTPGGFMPAMGAVLAPYLPPLPRSSAPPSRWGAEAVVAEMLSDAGLTIRRTSRERLRLDFSDSDEAVDFLVRTAGHLLVERDQLTAGGRWDAVTGGLAELVNARNDASGGNVSLELEYLVALAQEASE